MKTFFSMVMLTPKQIISKLEEYDYILLGALSFSNIIGLSNDFYIKPIINKTIEINSNLNYMYRPVSSKRFRRYKQITKLI